MSEASQTAGEPCSTATVPSPNDIPDRNFLHRHESVPDKPRVLVPGREITISQSAEQLFASIADSEEMFYRGGVVVEVQHETDGYTLNPVRPAGATSRFEKYVHFIKRM